MISIVIPVYNSEKYIKNCLDSICRQTYNEFEVILVDDGSVDSSYEICKEYCLKNEHFKVYKKENGGPSETRNYGIKKACGDFVTFIDSDDIVHKNYLEKLVDLQLKYNVDISCVGLSVENDELTLLDKVEGYDKVITGEEATLNLLYQKDLDTSPCALLIKKEIVERNLFPIGKYHEDDFTTYKYFQEADKVAVFTGKMYYYIQHSGSIMHSNGKVKYDEVEASNALVSVFKTKGEHYYKAAKSKRFSNFCQLVINHNEMQREDPETYNKIVSTLKNDKWDILFNRNTRWKNKVAAGSLFFGINGLKKLDAIRNRL